MGNKNHGVTFISASTSLEGEMQLAGSALVAGKLKGNIQCAGQLKIEFGGEVSGDVCCDELRVCGLFRGKVRCNKLIIVSSGVVEGEVFSHQLEIYEGGQFIGQRIKGPELDTLPQLLQQLIPENPSLGLTNTRVSTTTDKSQSGGRSRKWLGFGAAAAALIVVTVVLAPVEFSALSSNDSLVNRIESDVEQPQVNAVASSQDNSVDTEVPASLPLETAASAVMEDLDQMAAGHEQMAQQEQQRETQSGNL
ncbi:bactofilin family protein [Shewanella acanthi]|uniref:bactofilin family protein n=1 Tax=Shewanella acanthi TaxID=2864212 RepID=UPI001C65FC1E|nr:polymer-forming cytoskeletal protein [Shewanella acanthi]QYJ79530.1 polymer-forming cytoskeletal protein [Shewanella acanthi]